MCAGRFVLTLLCVLGFASWELGGVMEGYSYSDEFEGLLFEGFVDFNLVLPVSSDLTYVVSKECLRRGYNFVFWILSIVSD